MKRYQLLPFAQGELMNQKHVLIAVAVGVVAVVLLVGVGLVGTVGYFVLRKPAPDTAVAPNVKPVDQGGKLADDQERKPEEKPIDKTTPRVYTLADFNGLRLGMTKQEVEAKLGNGELANQTKTMPIGKAWGAAQTAPLNSPMSYRWNNLNGGFIVATFQGGTLRKKSQSDLN